MELHIYSLPLNAKICLSFPLELRNHALHVLYGKNATGKTRFCEALATEHPNRKVMFQSRHMESSDFSYLPAVMPRFFEMTGLQYLQTCTDAAPLDNTVDILLSFDIPLSQKVEEYSDSMKRLLLIFGLLASEKPVYLIDDLFLHLDPDWQLRVLSYMKRLASSKIILFTTSHAELIHSQANNGLYRFHYLEPEYQKAFAKGEFVHVK